MKTFNSFTLLLTVISAFTFVGCSKKITSSSTNDHYQQESLRLERNYPINTELYASANPADITPLKEETRFQTVASKSETQLVEMKKNTQKTKTITISKKDPLYKIIRSRIEESAKAKGITSEQASASRLGTGIILAVVGLVLILTAGLFGGAAPIVYVGGAIIFVVGIVLIILSVF